MKKSLFLLIFIVFLFYCVIVNVKVKAAYKPVISGKLDSGERLYIDFDEDENEEINDKYYYNKFWLNYKQKLSTAEYYYFKFQYYKKEYILSDTYNNIGLDLWGNYTYLLNDKTRNRWKVNIKDKNYFSNQDKSYNSYKLDYELDYDYNQKNDYGIIIQRQWNDFWEVDTKDYIRDKIKLEWDYDYSNDFKINTTLQYERQIHDMSSDSSNKYGKQISIGFDYKL